MIRVEARGRGLVVVEEDVGVSEPFPFREAAEGPMGEIEEEEEEEEDWKREPLRRGRG